MRVSGTNDQQRREGPPSSSWKERLIILLLILGATLGLLYYQMPKATILVTPQVVQLSEELVFDFAHLNGLEIKKSSIMLTRRTPATGRQRVGISQAKGAITLVNQKETPVIVPQGTLVYTGSGITFATAKEIEVPALATHYFMDVPVGLVAGQAEVEIEAVEFGSSGNVAAGRITSIKDFDLDVRNLDPTTGGEDAVLTIAIEEDLSRVNNLVKQEGPKLALNALLEEIGTGLMLEETMEYQLEILEESLLGQETSEVYVSALSKAQVYTVDLDLLGQQLQEVLQSIVPDGFELEPHSINFSDLQVSRNPDWQMTVTAEAQGVGVIDGMYLAQVLAGVNAADISQVLAEFPNVASIDVLDNGKNRLPRLAKWLNIQVEQVVY